MQQVWFPFVLNPPRLSRGHTAQWPWARWPGPCWLPVNSHPKALHPQKVGFPALLQLLTHEAPSWLLREKDPELTQLLGPPLWFAEVPWPWEHINQGVCSLHHAGHGQRPLWAVPRVAPGSLFWPRAAAAFRPYPGGLPWDSAVTQAPESPCGSKPLLSGHQAVLCPGQLPSTARPRSVKREVNAPSPLVGNSVGTSCPERGLGPTDGETETSRRGSTLSRPHGQAVVSREDRAPAGAPYHCKGSTGSRWSRGQEVPCTRRGVWPRP